MNKIKSFLPALAVFAASAVGAFAQTTGGDDIVSTVTAMGDTTKSAFLSVVPVIIGVAVIFWLYRLVTKTFGRGVQNA